MGLEFIFQALKVFCPYNDNNKLASKKGESL
jgi:hypothetical protein